MFIFDQERRANARRVLGKRKEVSKEDSPGSESSSGSSLTGTGSNSDE